MMMAARLDGQHPIQILMKQLTNGGKLGRRLNLFNSQHSILPSLQPQTATPDKPIALRSTRRPLITPCLCHSEQYYATGIPNSTIVRNPTHQPEAGICP